MANRTKTIQELNLKNDFLFGKVMSDTEICRKVVEKILNVPIKKVEFLVTQKTIDILLNGKGIRLDVYVNDEQSTIYSVEMQRGKKRELPMRTRFYQCNIDSDFLSHGQLECIILELQIAFPEKSGATLFEKNRNRSFC